jgi:uncharacterized protein YrrD
MANINRIERGARVLTQDGDFGEVYQVIVDPDTKALTHVVVTPSDGGDRLMIPARMITEADSGTVTLGSTGASLESMRSQLRYNEAEFQPVDPHSVEGAPASTAQGTQTIVQADSSTVELSGGAPSGVDSGTTTTTSDAGQGATVATFGGDREPSSGITFTAGEGTDTTDVTTTDTTTSGYTEATPVTSDLSTTTTDVSPQPAPEPQPVGPTGTGQQRKGKDLLGLNVLTFAEGENLGTPKDLLFDPESNRLVALLMSDSGWFSSARVIPWQNVKTLGHDSIIVPDRSSEISADNDPYINRILKGENVLTGTEVYTEDGRDLGKIQDMYIDDSTGEIIGYEVSGGMFQSIARGRKFMPAPQTITIGQDAAFVPNEVGDAMEQQVGGLQGAAQGATSSAGDALSTARDRVTTATAEQQRSFVIGKPVRSDVTGDNGEVLVPAGKVVDEGDVSRAESAGKLNALFLAAGGGAAGGLLDTVKERASGLTQNLSAASAQQRDQQLDNSIGKTVGRDVYADDGTAIALQGTVVDYATIERARAYGKENQLIAAVGAGQTQQTLQEAKQGVTGAIEGLRDKIDQTLSQQAEKREQQRIKEALGRPVTRVILDQSDNVILDTAQIVTNEAVERARAAGVLDILLDSVYTADPDLSPEALHSGVPGQASLESSYERQRKPEEPIT